MEGRELILEARRRAALTQAQLAARVGTTQSAIARVEGGGSSPSFRRVYQLVEACGFELRVRLASPPSRSSEPPRLTAEVRGLLAAMAERELSSIVIGDVAAILHGAPLEPAHLTIVPGDGRRDLETLASFLNAVNARIRVDGGSLPFERDAATVASMGRLELVTSLGPLGVDPLPPGTDGYRDLARDARPVEVPGGSVRVASLADVVRIADASDPVDDERIAILRRALADTLAG
jgi:transcriptional regulator with XRE-family HTH domain